MSSSKTHRKPPQPPSNCLCHDHYYAFKTAAQALQKRDEAYRSNTYNVTDLEKVWFEWRAKRESKLFGITMIPSDSFPTDGSIRDCRCHKEYGMAKTELKEMQDAQTALVNSKSQEYRNFIQTNTEKGYLNSHQADINLLMGMWRSCTYYPPH